LITSLHASPSTPIITLWKYSSIMLTSSTEWCAKDLNRQAWVEQGILLTGLAVALCAIITRRLIFLPRTVSAKANVLYHFFFGMALLVCGILSLTIGIPKCPSECECSGKNNAHFIAQALLVGYGIYWLGLSVCFVAYPRLMSTFYDGTTLDDNLRPVDPNALQTQNEVDAKTATPFSTMDMVQSSSARVACPYVSI
jgi:hypothetical protein